MGEFAVFWPGGHARVGSLAEAVATVERLHNDEGIVGATVHALTEVPLTVRASYGVVTDVATGEPVAEPGPVAPAAEPVPVPLVEPDPPRLAVVPDAPAAGGRSGDEPPRSLGMFARD